MLQVVGVAKHQKRLRRVLERVVHGDRVELGVGVASIEQVVKLDPSAHLLSDLHRAGD